MKLLKPTLFLPFLLTLTCLFLSQGCGSDSPTNAGDSPTTWTPSTSSADVSFTANTVYFDSSAISALISADTANRRYVLKESHPLTAQLDNSKYILLWRQGFGKVKSVTRSGGNVTVETDSCSVDKIVKDGTIRLVGIMEWTSTLHE